MSEKESRPRPNRPVSLEARLLYLRWRKFTWLPGDIEITVAGKERKHRTNNQDEEA